MGANEDLAGLKYLAKQRQSSIEVNKLDGFVFEFIVERIDLDMSSRTKIEPRCVIVSINNFYSIIRHLRDSYELKNFSDETYRTLKIKGYQIYRCIDLNDGELEIY